MRGTDTSTESLFFMRKPDEFVPPSHPLRVVCVMINAALAKVDRLYRKGKTASELALHWQEFHDGSKSI